MDMSAYAGLLDIILSGFIGALGFKALCAFLLLVLFVYGTVNRENEVQPKLGDVSWTLFSALSSFALFGVLLFLASTSLTSFNMADMVMGPLSWAQSISLLAVLFFIACGAWLYSKPVTKKKVSYDTEDDLSMGSIIAIAYGVGLSSFVFLGYVWPDVLMSQVKTVGVLQQGAFYGFVYMLSFTLVWFAFFALIQSVIGRFIMGKMPVVISAVALFLAALAQIIFLLV
tara:strand:- start:32112 stop:32795 length:684 start_codon:yes stop_codon:yes gene_type:complete